MCVAILAKPGKVVSNESLFKGWVVNSHGAGMAYVNREGKLVVSKGFMKYGEFQKAYERACNEARAEDSPMLVHMRITSAGDTVAANTHPFMLRPKDGPVGAMIHNGTMFRPSGEWAKPKEGVHYSDTRIVATAYADRMSAQAVLNSIVELGKAVGSGNKLAFLYEDKSWAIINENSGYWADDIWYSNGSCGVSRN